MADIYLEKLDNLDKNSSIIECFCSIVDHSNTSHQLLGSVPSEAADSEETKHTIETKLAVLALNEACRDIKHGHFFHSQAAGIPLPPVASGRACDCFYIGNSWDEHQVDDWDGSSWRKRLSNTTARVFLGNDQKIMPLSIHFSDVLASPARKLSECIGTSTMNRPLLTSPSTSVQHPYPISGGKKGAGGTQFSGVALTRLPTPSDIPREVQENPNCQGMLDIVYGQSSSANRKEKSELEAGLNELSSQNRPAQYDNDHTEQKKSGNKSAPKKGLKKVRFADPDPQPLGPQSQSVSSSFRWEQQLKDSKLPKGRAFSSTACGLPEKSVVKSYCIPWIKRSECPSGWEPCEFPHIMPLDLKTLRRIGEQDIPNWYRITHNLPSLRSVEEGKASASALQILQSHIAAKGWTATNSIQQATARPPSLKTPKASPAPRKSQNFGAHGPSTHTTTGENNRFSTALSKSPETRSKDKSTSMEQAKAKINPPQPSPTSLRDARTNLFPALTDNKNKVPLQIVQPAESLAFYHLVFLKTRTWYSTSTAVHLPVLLASTYELKQSGGIFEEAFDPKEESRTFTLPPHTASVPIQAGARQPLDQWLAVHTHKNLQELMEKLNRSWAWDRDWDVGCVRWHQVETVVHHGAYDTGGQLVEEDLMEM